jgi:hypothetical protein
MSSAVVSAGGGERADRDFWRSASATDRLAAVTEMAEEWYRLHNPDGPPLRLDRTAWGVRRSGRDDDG